MAHQNIITLPILERFELENIDDEMKGFLPTWSSVVDGLQYYKKFGKISDDLQSIVVMPANKYIDKKGQKTRAEVINFAMAIWKADWQLSDDKRSVNFSRLTGRLEFEAKIVCLAELWLHQRKSKLNSLLRKCSYIIKCAEACQDEGILSLFHLGQHNLFEKIQSNLRKTMSHDSSRNYLLALTGLNDLQHTPFKAYGFYISTDIRQFIKGRNDGNQTYCMPFSILSKLWNGVKEYAENIESEYLPEALPLLSKLGEFCREYPQENKSIGFRPKEKTWTLYWAKSENQSLLRAYYEKHPDDGVVINREKAQQKALGVSKDAKRYWASLKNFGIDYYPDHTHLSRAFHRINRVLKIGIQAYTGMRESESKDVKLGGLIIDTENGYIGVHSKLTKFAPERGSDEIWAAAPWVEIMFRVAKKIARSIYGHLSEQEIRELNFLVNIKSYVTTNLITKLSGKANREFQIPETIMLAQITDMRILKEEINEFYQLNKNINNFDIIKKEIFLNNLWPLRSHQYRRSIAVHTKRLGAVNNRALAFQFKHRSRTQSDWYSDGGSANSIYKNRVSEKLKSNWKHDEDTADAEIAVELQENPNLFGRGGELLKSQQGGDESVKIYPSIKKAKQMAIRGKSKLKALGHGMYCLNGDNCKMQALLHSSACNPECENFVADERAITYNKNRYSYYTNLITNSIKHRRTEAQIEYLKLEQESHKEFLDSCGISI
ncbi:hypothetical protein ACTXIM_16290 [Pseudoalteromonas nigrifaciens]|uniref:hypothetical protein n=1 Tax=Pseudoalteromonas nigrifaciens TaxID=28109 RepID=UPI001865F1DB|nr:hypothetical protein [Pseudoalteromonas nigrifaciens]